MTAPAQEIDDGLPKEGDLLAGKYRVERVLGQGGMGVVVAAQHLTLRQTVAVKLLLPEAMERRDSVERFLREGRAAVSIQSEHIARVLDVGTLDSGQPFMVMEYLVGQDLGETVRSRGPLPISEAVDYVLQACEAIAEAHMLGIVHRDLKPANIFVTRRADGSPLVKVLDFGLSKVTKADTLEPSLTSANTVMGSPYYMSPEQVRSLKSIDARADIWALGVILYELVSGKRPFAEESLGALFVMIGAEPPAPIRQYLPDIPPELEAIIYKCLEKAPANRYQTVAELARALAHFASDGARVSIERILRVLADTAPLTAARPRLDSLSEIDRSSNAGSLGAGSLAPPGTNTGPAAAAQSGPRATSPSAPPPAVDPDAKPPSQKSMPGMSKTLGGPAIEAGAETGRRPAAGGSRALVYVGLTVGALIAGAGSVMLLMRGSAPTVAASGDPAPRLVDSIAATSSAAASPGPQVVPAPPAVVTVVSSATAAASASAVPTVTPAGSVSAAPTATAAASSTASGAPGSKKWVSPKKKTDPLDRR
jgi:serine/threonine-protein kinase